MRLLTLVILLILLNACGQTSTLVATPMPPTSVPTSLPTPTQMPMPTAQPSITPVPTTAPTPSAGSTDGPAPDVSLTLDHPMHLSVGMVVRASNGLELRVDSLKDSRCPPHVECVWSGEVVVELTLKDQDRVVGSPSLHIFADNIPPKEADWHGQGYTVSLLAIDPPTRPANDIQIQDYRISVLVRKAEAQQAAATTYIPVGAVSPNAVIVPRSLVAHYLKNVQGSWSEEGYWQPLPQDIAVLEAALPEYLRTAAASRSPELWQKSSSYKRQYAGTIEQGNLFIHMNAFCDATGKDWQQEPVVVMDGGDCYFTLVYNFQTGTFERLNINGSS